MTAREHLESLIAHLGKPGKVPVRATVLRHARAALAEIDCCQSVPLTVIGTDGVDSAWPGTLPKTEQETFRVRSGC